MSALCSVYQWVGAAFMKVAILTTGRHDLSYLMPVSERLSDCTWIDASPKPSRDDASAAMESASVASHVAMRLVQHNPDYLVVLGDRTETLAACVAATCLKVPIAHIHGGEVTLGAIDNVCRHAISQLACLHFAATQDAYDRLVSMHVPGTVHLTGSPAIDLMMRKKRERIPGKDIVFAYHPETLSDVPPLEQIKSAVDIALQHLPEGGKVICVGANPDAGGKQINDYLCSLGDPFVMQTGMGSEWYWDTLATCHALVGNSSSGVIEAPALGVPFIEVGDRQKGRYRGSYGDGHATERIVDVLRASSPAQPQLACL
jgi:UDP-hydrolysing UDP-N-acetyl-D-glucosamine 2-epimerase